MKIKLNIYKEDKPNLMVSWDMGNSFEESVIDSVFGRDKSILARRYGNSISLEEMDEELEKIIKKYFKKKYDSENDGGGEK